MDYPSVNYAIALEAIDEGMFTRPYGCYAAASSATSMLTMLASTPSYVTEVASCA